MTAGRTYRDPLSHERALDELRAGAGSQFDADLVHVVLHCPPPPEDEDDDPDDPAM